MKPAYLSTAKVVETATDYGIKANALLFADDLYALPSNSWVIDTFSEAWAKTKLILGIAAYEVDMNDCDDYARMCAGYAQVLNNQTIKALGLQRAALAFGEFWYTSPQGAHAINAYLYREDQNSPVMIGTFEPQTGKPVELTRQQFYTCSLFRL